MSWNKFGAADYAERKTFSTTKQFHPDREYKQGDFLVHVRYATPTDLQDFLYMIQDPCKLTNVLTKSSAMTAVENDVREESTTIKVMKTPSNVVQRQNGGDVWRQLITISPETHRLRLFKTLYTSKRILHVGCIQSMADWPFVKEKEDYLHYQLSQIVESIDCIDTNIDGLYKMANIVAGRYYSSSLDALDQIYDAILVPETIEHVPNMASFLQSLEKLNFKEIFISCPNIAINPNFNWHFSKINETHMVEHIHPDHKMWGSPYTLVNLIEQYTNLNITDVWLLQDNSQVAVRAMKVNINT